MGQVIWSPTALDDVDAIAAFIARDSVDQASLFAIRFIEAAEKLADFANAGRIIPELNDAACRELFVASYRLMYRIDEDDVWITGVIHGARDWKPE